jgi:1-acyl-sn-glycerol-3-phosphate acyltransferase
VLYRAIHAAAWPLLAWSVRFKVRGARHVPPSGGVVLAANHASVLDPVVIGNAVTRRPLSFMAKEELFRIPVFGRLIRRVNAVPIRRGVVDRTAMAEFGRLLRVEGRALLVFPEGTRTSDGSLGEARRGVAALCLAARVPVIPVLVTGTFEMWPRGRRFPRWHGRIEVRFGPPVQWSDRELNASGDPSTALAKRIMERIASLRTTEEPAHGFWDGYREVIFRRRADRQGVNRGGEIQDEPGPTHAAGR